MNRRATFVLCTFLAACSRSAAAPAPAETGAAPSTSSAVIAANTQVDASGPTGPAHTLRDTTLAKSQAYETVRSLVDEVGPRFTGSPGDRAAVAWAKRTLAAAGLQNVRAEKVMAPRWERGDERGEIVAPYPHRLALTALGGSVGTPKEGLSAEVVRVASLDALDKLDPNTIKGKIVFYDVPMERTRTGEGYGRAVGVRGRGASRASKYGAVGVVIRSIGTDHSRMPHTGAMRYQEGIKPIPAAALSNPDADLLARIVATGQKVTLRMNLSAQKMPEVETANVIGEVPGSAAKDEIVLLGAHLDSWDLGQGAVDDGAGCAVVIEAGRQIAALAQKPRRTVRVVLFANEESGLAGARAYAKAHEAEVPKHIAALEADLGAGRVYEARILGDEKATARFQELAALLGPLEIKSSNDRAHGGADISPLVELGVPAIDLRQDATRYFDVHHTADDTLAQIDKDDIAQVSAAFTTMAFALANAPFDLGRAPKEQDDKH